MNSTKPICRFTFIVLVIGGGTVFKLSSLKDAFYVPMQEFMNLTIHKLDSRFQFMA